MFRFIVSRNRCCTMGNCIIFCGQKEDNNALISTESTLKVREYNLLITNKEPINTCDPCIAASIQGWNTSVSHRDLDPFINSGFQEKTVEDYAKEFLSGAVTYLRLFVLCSYKLRNILHNVPYGYFHLKCCSQHGTNKGYAEVSMSDMETLLKTFTLVSLKLLECLENLPQCFESYCFPVMSDEGHVQASIPVSGIKMFLRKCTVLGIELLGCICSDYTEIHCFQGDIMHSKQFAKISSGQQEVHGILQCSQPHSQEVHYDQAEKTLIQSSCCSGSVNLKNSIICEYYNGDQDDANQQEFEAVTEIQSQAQADIIKIGEILSREAEDVEICEEENCEPHLGRGETCHHQSLYTISFHIILLLKTMKHLYKWFSFLMMILLLSVNSVCAAFNVAPVSQEVASGASAVFMCRHLNASVIDWSVNGSLVQRDTPLDITPGTTRDDNRELVETLTITARPEYNETEVVCVARFDDGRPEERTHPAVLFVLVNSRRFFPSPVSLNVTLDTVAAFHCHHITADSINWEINGTIRLPEGMRSYLSEDGVYTLNIPTLPKYNHVMIKCVAFFDDLPPEKSHPALLMIQGSLDGLSDVQRNLSTLTWIPPPSLDLTGIDPDIVYCVVVYNITCGRRDHIISDCNVTEPNYTSAYIVDGYVYEYTVIPRSNMEGASNGTSVTVAEKYVTLKSLKQNYMMDRSEVIVTINADILNEQDFAENGILAKSYSISLISLDGQNDDEIKHLPNMRNKNLVMFRVSLPFRRLWNYTVLAHDCDEHPLTNSTLLSTHDMQDISIISLSAGTIRITGNFIPDSPAAGIVVAVLNSSIISFYLLRREGNQLDNEGIVSNIRGGQHMVSVFIVSQTGLPFTRTATIPQNVVVSGSIRQTFPIEYEVKSTSFGVCITCTFLEHSATDCVALVHQQISRQFSSSGLMNIESSHKFNRSGDTAYGCIEGLDIYRHQVGIIDGIRKETPKLTKESTPGSCSTLCQALIAVILLTLSLAISIIIIFIFIYISRKKQKVRLVQRTSMHESVDVLESGTQSETDQLRIQSGHTRVEMDTSSTTDISTVSGEGPPLDNVPSLPPPKSMDTDPVYTKVVTVSDSRKVIRQPEHQVLLNQVTASQTSQNENEVPTEDPLHTEHNDNEDTCDASQHNQQEDMDKDDYRSSFDEQANEPSESGNQDGGQFESGKGASPLSETASDTRNVFDVNKSEEHQSNICTPLPFHTEYGEQNLMVNEDVHDPRSGTCSWSESVDGASELVISSNWNFLKQGKIVVGYCLHSKDA